jgi:hypothetical protein
MKATARSIRHLQPELPRRRCANLIKRLFQKFS